MLDSISLNKIQEQLSTSKKVLIFSHLNPDGDALGSSLGLALFLKKAGHEVGVVVPNKLPDFLKWMPGFDLLTVYSQSQKHVKGMLSEAELLFFLDFNELNRIGELEEMVRDHKAFKIMIDHHEGPAKVADLIISESWRGSVGEMIYKFIEELGATEMLDKDIATCLYVAIMTDTGNFRHSSSYGEIFKIVGELISQGIDKNDIYSRVFDSYSENRLKLMGYAMSKKLVLLNDGKAAYISLTQEELDSYHHQIGDTEGFVNVPFSIQGVECSALFIEKKDKVKISLRSKGNFSVADLAAEHFNGGGHINAAGGEAPLPLKDALEKFESLLSPNNK